MARPWQEYLNPDRTFAVEASVRDSAFNHSGFVALRVKDAIADALRQGPFRQAPRTWTGTTPTCGWSSTWHAGQACT